MRTAEKTVKDSEQAVKAAETAFKSLETEITALSGKIKDAEKARDLTAIAMTNAQTAAERILRELDAAFTRCSGLTVNGKAYTPNDIRSLLLNGKELAEAMATETYPTPEDIALAERGLKNFKDAEAKKRTLDEAIQEADKLDAEIGAYTNQIQTAEEQISSAVASLDAAVRQELIELRQTLETTKSVIGKLKENDANFLQQVQTAAEKPQIWARDKIMAYAQAKMEAVKREREARDTRENLVRDFENYSDVKEKFAVTARQAKIYRTLAEKLHNKGLQSWLRVAAERSIVANADVILQRLSDNMLTVKLAEDDNGVTLDLRVTDFEKGARDLRPQALSGSQKFRLSVALALGIGQYACNQTQGGIKSVIIDEGFGGLDKEGREQMIIELRNLSKFLERIIVVSHQEEFQEAADFCRWNIFVANGTAQAERAG